MDGTPARRPSAGAVSGLSRICPGRGLTARFDSSPARRRGLGPVGGWPGGEVPLAAPSSLRSIVVPDRAEAALLGEQRIAAVAEQVQVERLVGLLLAVALHHDRDGLAGLACGEGQRAGPRDVVAVALRRGAINGLE